METAYENLVRIPLEVLPNQSLTIRLNDDRYEIRIITVAENLMAVSIQRNDVLLIQNQRVVPNVLMLSGYLANGEGNFLFSAPDDSYPFYEEFNNGHDLYFIPEGDG